MALFHRRPLALICACFLVGMVLYRFLPFSFALRCAVAAGVLLLALAALILRRFLKCGRWNLLILSLCLFAVLAAFGRSVLAFDVAQSRAERYTGDRRVEMNVIEENYSSEYSAEYTVMIRKVGEDSVRIRALLVCPFSCDLLPGDRVCAAAGVHSMDDVTLGFSGRDRTDDESVRLVCVVYDREDGVFLRQDKQGVFSALFSEDGFAICGARLRRGADALIEKTVGGETGALVKGFLMGDRSELSGEDVRDFRRAGAAHLLAVSGLHISILLGAMDWFLRRLYVPCVPRRIVLVLLSVGLLMLTGFSRSSCRAVLMLWAVFVSRMFAEDSDATTALFLAGAVIFLFSPSARSDTGFWMSFAATLGLVTVYPALFRNHEQKSSARHPMLSRFGRRCLQAVAVALIANLFLLPIQWHMFGEISFSGILANLVLSPLTAVFLCLIPTALILGAVPVLGRLPVLLLSWVARAILWTVHIFARNSFAVLSLQYGFSKFLIPLYALALAAFLVFRFRRLWRGALLPATALVAFAVCICAFRIFVPVRLRYTAQGDRETLAVTDGSGAVLFDLEGDRYRAQYEAVDRSGISSYRALVLTGLHDGQAQKLEGAFKRYYTDTLYLPAPTDDAGAEVAQQLAEIAGRFGTRTVCYRSGEELALFSGTSAVVLQDGQNGGAEGIGVFTKEAHAVYAVFSPKMSEDERRLVASGDRILVSATSDTKRGLSGEIPLCRDPQSVLYGSRAVWKRYPVIAEDCEILVPPEGAESFSYIFRLS